MASVDITGGQGSGGGNFVSGAYLSAYDTGSYNIITPLTTQTLQFGTTTLSSGITIAGANNTDIVFSGPGIYNIAFSVQVTCNTPQAHLFYLWLCFNGSPVTDSNSILTIHGTHGGNNGHMITAWDFMVNAGAGDSYQLCWSANDPAIAVETIASPGGGIPLSPAVILSVSQV